MPLEMIDSCPHDISDQDIATQVDGLCPLCLAADVNRLSIALEKIESDLRVYASGLKEGDELRGVLQLSADEARAARVPVGRTLTE